jgi:methionyl-tRNA synthetase
MNIIQYFGLIQPGQNIINCSRFDGMTFIGILLLVIIIIWSLFWKALALWHAAKNNSKLWFIALLFINTLGILEIVYLYFIAKVKLCRLCNCDEKCDCKDCDCKKKKK